MLYQRAENEDPHPWTYERSTEGGAHGGAALYQEAERRRRRHRPCMHMALSGQRVCPKDSDGYHEVRTPLVMRRRSSRT